WMFYEVKGWLLEAETIFGLIATRLLPRCLQEYNADQTAATPECMQAALFQTLLGTAQWRRNRLQVAEESVRLVVEKILPEVPEAQWSKAFAVFVLGTIDQYQGEISRSIEQLKRAVELAQPTGDVWLTALINLLLSQSLQHAGDHDAYEPYLNQAAQLYKELDEQILSCYVWSDLGRQAMYRGEWTKAQQFLQKGISQRNVLDYRLGMAYIFRDLGNVARLQGNFSQAKEHFQQGIATAKDINFSHGVSESLWWLGNLAIDEGDYERALDYFNEFDRESLSSLRTEIGGSGWAMLGLERVSEAKQYFEARLQDMINHDVKLVGLDALIGMAHVKARAGQLKQALELLALVRYHSSSTYEIREKVHKLQAELTAELPPDLITKAEARGRELDLFETAESLLAEEATS
ncbi:MAG: tetratricopeptide repeat protein, partial [Chloroflexi bacterium]|nr:tetratricopeptide repeat protein [Chloroflexota bacterium]